METAWLYEMLPIRSVKVMRRPFANESTANTDAIASTMDSTIGSHATRMIVSIRRPPKFNASPTTENVRNFIPLPLAPRLLPRPRPRS